MPTPPPVAVDAGFVERSETIEEYYADGAAPDEPRSDGVLRYIEDLRALEIFA